jgi:hypothetical protein
VWKAPEGGEAVKYVSDFLAWFVLQYGKRPELSMEESQAVKWDRDRDIALKGWCAGRNYLKKEVATCPECSLKRMWSRVKDAQTEPEKYRKEKS